MKRLVALSGFFLVAVTAAGCFGCNRECREGDSLVCRCNDGELGTATCERDGVIGPCSCDVPSDAAIPDASASDAGSDSSIDAATDSGACVPAVPAVEVCNGVDDDCDGATDF